MDSGNRVVLVTEAFPLPSETFIIQRFVGLLERGWDMHVVCSSKRADLLSMFPSLSADRFGARVHERPRKRHRLITLVLVGIVLARCLAQAPRRTLRYLRHASARFGWRVVGALYHDHQLVFLGPDIVHFTFGWFAPGRSYLRGALGTKIAVSFQGADLNYGGLESEPGFYDEVWESVDVIHFLGNDLRRRATFRGYVPDARGVVVFPGIDLDAFTAQRRERQPDEPLRILSVGRLHWKKGYEFALVAVRNLLDEGIECVYRIVGDGPDREAAVYARHDLGLVDVVEFLGDQPASRVREQMQWADVLLHSATSEGFCYAVVEAQAMCLPVVTSDADGLPENVADGETGFVVPRRDSGALTRALAKLARDPSLRDKFGNAGRVRARALFDAEREIDGLEDLYRRAIHDSSLAGRDEGRTWERVR